MNAELLYDIDVKSTSKWYLLTSVQKGRFLDLLDQGPGEETLLSFHDLAVEENATIPTEGLKDTDPLKVFATRCVEELTAKVKEGREHVWTGRGVSNFRDAVRDSRTRVLAGAATATEFAKSIIEVEKKSGIKHSEAGLKVISAAYAKLATGVVNSHTSEGRALLREAKQELAGIKGLELREEELKAREKLKTRELDERATTKMDAGLNAIEREAGKNPKIKAALNSIRAILQETTA